MAASAPMAEASATSCERADEVSESSQKRSRLRHVCSKRGRRCSSGRKVRRSRATELSVSTHVSSHCFDAARAVQHHQRGAAALGAELLCHWPTSSTPTKALVDDAVDAVQAQPEQRSP